MIVRGFEDPDAGWFKAKNAWARDGRISWEAFGLLGYLHSHRDGYPLTIDSLYRKRIAGRKKVDRMIRELEEAGYVERHREREANGRLGPTIWTLLDPS